MKVAYLSMMTFFAVGYLVSIIYFIDYLRRIHYRTWVNLGEPELAKIRTGSIRGAAQQLQAFIATWGFIFSNAYASMGDSRLSILVWRLRILMAGFLFLLPGAFLLP
jgi:hypothetical protein